MMRLNRVGRREYDRQRREGATASYAIYAARVWQRWDRLEAAGLVRLEVQYDDSPDLSWLDQTDDQMGRGFERIAEKQRERAYADGCWGIVGQWRTSADDDDGWETADSVWGFIGDDWNGSGYDVDVMAQTIDALREGIRSRCPHCGHVAA